MGQQTHSNPLLLQSTLHSTKPQSQTLHLRSINREHRPQVKEIIPQQVGMSPPRLLSIYDFPKRAATPDLPIRRRRSASINSNEPITPIDKEIQKAIEKVVFNKPKNKRKSFLPETPTKETTSPFTMETQTITPTPDNE